TYEDIVSVSHHVLHLAPRRHPRQRALESAMLIDPSPSVDSQGKDYFGNPVHYLTVQEPHDQLVVEARSRIDVHPLPVAIDLGAREPWVETRESIAAAADDTLLQALQFVFDSPYSVANEDVRDYALQSFVGDRPVLEAAMDLTSRIYDEFE